MTADVELDTLTRLAQTAKAPRLSSCCFHVGTDRCKCKPLALVDPDVVLALVERVRAVEAAVEQIEAACRDWAVQRFDERGPHDQRGAALWDVASWIGDNMPESNRTGPESDSGLNQAVPPLPVDTETVSERSIRAMQEKAARRCTCLIVVQVGPNWQHAPSCPQNAANEGDA